MPQTVGDLELYMGPQEVGGPDDLRTPIIDFIDGARKRLDIAVQELDSPDIADAIVRARERKVQVRLVVEGDYLRAGKVSENPWIPGGKYEINREIQNAILPTAINIRSDYNPSIFHDGSALLTGSTNFTDSGTSTNLNHLVIVRDRKVANLYSREYRDRRPQEASSLLPDHCAWKEDPTNRAVPFRGTR
jgi:phosphatidylserine/phosphatidylglycerophosphate/cardiolipin synthase-like enzyme